METVALADLRCFLAIARNVSITRAAQALRAPKAGVSKSLARLEGRLGVRLFERSTRRLAITRAGTILERRAEEILGDIGRLVEELHRDDHEVRGTLGVAAPPEVGAVLGEGLFAEYLARHPHVRVALKLDYRMHDLFDPDIDLAFRAGTIRDESMVAHTVGAYHRVLVASPRLLARRPVRDLAALKAAPCLVFSESAGPYAWTLSNGKRTESVEVDGRFCARSFPALLAAARAGMGVAELPDLLAAAALERGELARVLAPWRSPEMPIFLLHRVGHHRVRRVAALLELVAERPDLVPGGADARARGRRRR